MNAIGVFLVNIFLLVCFLGEMTLARDDRESSEMDSKIVSMVQTLQGICIQDNPDQTAKQLKKHTQTMLNNIGLYKEIVKLNKQLTNEIQWIVKESNGPVESKRLFDLLKRDAKEVCGKPIYKDCTEIKEESKEKLKSGVYTIHLGLEGTTSIKAYCDMTTDGGGWTVINKRSNGTGGYSRKWTECENGYGDIRNEFWFGDKLANHNGRKFTTVDQDNDLYSGNCADNQKGAWWYIKCSYCDPTRGQGIYWNQVKDLEELVMMIRKT